MPRVSANQIADTLLSRLNEGAYADGSLPSERDLAGEFCVARLTVRRALERLLAAQMVVRLGNGRLAGNSAAARNLFQVGFLITHLNSCDLAEHLRVMSRVAAERGVKIKPVYYESWEDPILSFACDNFDALVLIPKVGMPAWILKKLLTLDKPVLVVEGDYSREGLVSFNVFSPRAVDRLMDYLCQTGHCDVDLLNISPWNHVQTRRRRAWENALAHHHGRGSVLDFGLPENELPAAELREIFRRRIASGDFLMERAKLATSWPAARIFARAAADEGLIAGSDYSLAVIDGENQAEYHLPSITSIERVDACIHYRKYFEWMCSGGRWSGPMLQEITDCRIHAGETVVPRHDRKNRNCV